MGVAKIFGLFNKDLIHVVDNCACGSCAGDYGFGVLIPMGRDASERFVPGVYSSTIILNDKPLHVRVFS